MTATPSAIIASTKLIPEPLDDVLEREERQRAQVAEQLRQLRN
jgi:hypothetical protein